GPQAGLPELNFAAVGAVEIEQKARRDKVRKHIGNGLSLLENAIISRNIKETYKYIEYIRTYECKLKANSYAIKQELMNIPEYNDELIEKVKLKQRDISKYDVDLNDSALKMFEARKCYDDILMEMSKKIRNHKNNLPTGNAKLQRLRNAELQRLR